MISLVPRLLASDRNKAIVSLIQDQQNGGYLEDNVISPLHVPRCKNTGLVQLHSTVLALPPKPNQLLRTLTRTTPAVLKQSAPNGVCHVVGEFMTY